MRRGGADRCRGRLGGGIRVRLLADVRAVPPAGPQLPPSDPGRLRDGLRGARGADRRRVPPAHLAPARPAQRGGGDQRRPPRPHQRCARDRGRPAPSGFLGGRLRMARHPGERSRGAHPRGPRASRPDRRPGRRGGPARGDPHRPARLLHGGRRLPLRRRRRAAGRGGLRGQRLRRPCRTAVGADRPPLADATCAGGHPSPGPPQGPDRRPAGRPPAGLRRASNRPPLPPHHPRRRRRLGARRARPEALRGSGRAQVLWTLPGVGHVGAYFADRSAYIERVSGFFDRALDAASRQ